MGVFAAAVEQVKRHGGEQVVRTVELRTTCSSYSGNANILLISGDDG